MKDNALNKKYELQFKDASNRFTEEFDDLNSKIDFLKDEVERYREYKLKFEFIEKDFWPSSTAINFFKIDDQLWRTGNKVF